MVTNGYEVTNTGKHKTMSHQLSPEPGAKYLLLFNAQCNLLVNVCCCLQFDIVSIIASLS